MEKVDCRYFYLLEHPHPITSDRERRPHDPDKIFEPGDFEKLYKKIMNTVQILLRNGINKEAFAVAFQKLMGIKELLTQLQTIIEAETNLTDKNKEKALKQVKALAEAAQNPKEPEKQDLADTAITMLKGLISGLPSAATLVEACNKLLPAIASLLGLG